ncbi:Uncharacterized protein GBIM_01792 [Gryllus bimaculatus]|nr:Uncharacterized protein GBIM_01792 [Gryllus bimaculatus]
MFLSFVVVYELFRRGVMRWYFCDSWDVSVLIEVSSGAGWGGRACCGLPQALACRRACATASSRQALRPACRLSDELAFFACVDRQQVLSSAHEAMANLEQPPVWTRRRGRKNKNTI